ncbi:hypothetical protein PSTG_13161 [Puccinia striiformis f. sp. tritici PST-78]|uniref:Uncharacterized protein n=2 Tax=Puccinia striiformis TaxID=27350 RepID=A0A0L0V387_9BASI|nr:hypothetical protein PSTG_13161 [Puccinia striiformis f. sp. tritici PST-78]
MLKHKQNADTIHTQDGSMPALRYDIQVRANTLSHHVVTRNRSSVPDISISREDIAETCYAEARRFNRAPRNGGYQGNKSNPRYNKQRNNAGHRSSSPNNGR